MPHRHSLDAFFKPASVAVVGASATPASVGSILIRNLLENPFGGVVYPVNPRRHAVHGVLCYPSLNDLPEAVDLAIIATPAATVLGIIQQCVARGVRAAIIISAGFSELGTAGRALEREIRDVARGNMRIVGPNCLGIIQPHFGLNASFAACMARPGRVALLSQSGAICTSVLDWARESYVGFSGFVSVGTMLDVDFADLLDYFGDDPNTHSIVLYMESVGDARRFFSAARAVAKAKHVIVVKAGRHDAGARAAASHTGALAGSDAVFDAAVRRAGLLRVTTIPELFNMAEILGQQPPPRGPALCIISNAGGPGVMAADELMIAGGALAAFGPITLDALNEVLPPFWSHANPVDVLGDATPKRYRQAVEVCAKDPAVQGLLVLLTPQAMTDPTETARQLVPFAHSEGKPILASWMGGADVREGRSVLGQAGIATFDSPEAAIRAFMHMVQYQRSQDLLYEAPAALPQDWQPNVVRAHQIIDEVRARGRTLLTEPEAKELLACYGIPTVPTRTARSADEAVVLAGTLGFPVVLKLWSEIVTHKTDAGGVQLNLQDDEAVRRAFALIEHNAARYAEQHGLAQDSFLGVTVQPMIQHQGYELIVGSSVDAQFGPVILFGAGGVLVEVFEDRALGLPPLNRALARRLIERTRIAKALQGIRGARPVPMDQLETLLVRFSYLLCELSAVQELDINPLLATPEGVLALDARVLLVPADMPEENRPQPAIEPYPNQYTSSWQLSDGTAVVIRAIRPEDEALLIAHHASLSELSIRMRFFSMVKTLNRANLIRLCHLDYAREMALVAERRSPDGQPEILGVSRYYLSPETREAEFAIIVTDTLQGQGLGQHLMQRLIEVARVRGVRTLFGHVLRENAPMLALAKELGFTQLAAVDGDAVQVALELGTEEPTRCQH
jgi:acetyltransferase